MLQVLHISLLALGVAVYARPIDIKTMTYLVQYGYLDPKIPQSTSILTTEEMDALITAAMVDFQNFVGLPASGELDDNTQEIMESYRCGMKDNYRIFNETALRNFVWPKRNLTYSINRYPREKNLKKAAVNEVLGLAFAVWSNVTNLTFRQISGKADINITFLDRFHGDGYPFKKKELAHVLMPPVPDIHFNNLIKWTIRRDYGWNLFKVALHEIGHSLGLDHTNVSGSIMQPIFTGGYTQDFSLHEYDVETIQAKYGEKVDPVPNLCEDSVFDAMFHYPDGRIYVFKGKYFWELGHDGIVNSYPHHIRHHWTELPDNLDAALATSSYRTYFFKGEHYWAYDYKTLASDYSYPRLISKGWPGIPDDIHAAFWFRNSKFYFFKGTKFWLYNSYLKPPVSVSDYPKEMTEWDMDIVGEINDVIRSRDGYIFFFIDDEYYRYNNMTGQVDARFPKASRRFFRCDQR